MLTMELNIDRVIEVLLSPLGVYVGNFDCERRVEEDRDLWYLPGFHEIRDLIQHELCTFYGKSRNEYRSSTRNCCLKSVPHLFHSSLLGVYPIAIHALHDEYVCVGNSFRVGEERGGRISNIARYGEARSVFRLNPNACRAQYVSCLTKYAGKAGSRFPLVPVLNGLHTRHERLNVVLVIHGLFVLVSCLDRKSTRLNSSH